MQVLDSYGFENLPDYGGWRPVRCQFHLDRHASASVNPDEGVFKCHVCDIGGDAYAVVMAREGIGFPEAKRFVQNITGISYGSVREESFGGRSKLPAWTRDRRKRRKALQARHS